MSERLPARGARAWDYLCLLAAVLFVSFSLFLVFATIEGARS
ncbi:hypothetical protein ACETRX_22990 [Labrys portucalensis]|uniref:Uncharacterized protein n=1 Tax=Labrys neptuniae TaxID=376174 RepID=A0ABV6ZK11_9HYPH|nr:hypothetical protein [Labrys sp. WJW]